MRKIGIALLIGVAALAIAGCGSSKKETDTDAAQSGRGTVTCSGTATTDPTGLPADFPTIDGVIYTKVSTDGPSQVVDGYADKSLGDLYDAYKSAFESGGYTILFSEKEEDDAEVSYQTGDKASQGQVALRSCDEDKTSIHITNRPS